MESPTMRRVTGSQAPAPGEMARGIIRHGFDQRGIIEIRLPFPPTANRRRSGFQACDSVARPSMTPSTPRRCCAASSRVAIPPLRPIKRSPFAFFRR